MSISLKNINKSYNGKIVLENCNLNLKKNGIYYIGGESGCGKTTLLNIIAGYIPIDSGERIVSEQLSMAMIFQNFELIEEISVRENIYLSHKLLNINQSNANIIIEKLNLTELLDHYPWEISYGQQQRVAIARTLMQNSNVILCDEPTESLDLKNRVMVLELLKEFSKDCIIVIVGHDKELLNKYCNEYYVIENNTLKKITGESCKSKHILKKDNKLRKNELYKLLTHFTVRNNIINYFISFILLFSLMIGIKMHNGFQDNQIGFLNDNVIYQGITYWGKSPLGYGKYYEMRVKYQFDNQIQIHSQNIKTTIVSIPSIHDEISINDNQGIIINQFLEEELKKAYKKDNIIGEKINLIFQMGTIYKHIFTFPIVGVLHENKNIGISQLYYPYDIIDSYLGNQVCIYNDTQINVKDFYKEKFAQYYEVIYEPNQNILDIYATMRNNNVNCHNSVLDSMKLNTYQFEMFNFILIIIIFIVLLVQAVLINIFNYYESKKQMRKILILHSLGLNLKTIHCFDFVIHCINYITVLCMCGIVEYLIFPICCRFINLITHIPIKVNISPNLEIIVIFAHMLLYIVSLHFIRQLLMKKSIIEFTKEY